MNEAKQPRWAVLGTGVIANQMAAAFQAMGRTLDAVGNRTYEKAAAFAEKYGVKKVYRDYREMFTDPDIDVIYLTTPHNTHMAYLEQALSHGKHVLCEKSITLNSAELERAVELAEENHVVLAEAVIVDAATGQRETVKAGRTADALVYELEDMEAAIRGEGGMLLPYTMDVMELMTALRKEWGVVYPEEE